MTAKWIIRPTWRGADLPDRIVLTLDCCFTVDGVPYWLPAGYDCDGASIPYAVQLLAGSPFEGSNAEPAWAHDVLYLTHAVTRAVADEVLYQFKLVRELAEGKRPWRARLNAWKMWAGVRVGGAFAWRNNQKDRDELERIKLIISQRPDVDKFKNLWFSQAII